MPSALSKEQRQSLGEWRHQSIANDHILGTRHLREIEAEIGKWTSVDGLAVSDNFYELLDLYDAQGERTGVQSWRGLCHWLWLRHGCVDGMLFTPSRMAVIQRRAATVADSPGYLDMSFAGHTGTSRIRARDEMDGPQALESEAAGETGVDLLPASTHVAEVSDLAPTKKYMCIEPPRPDDEFYNIEVRHVFAIRLTNEGVGAIHAPDGEVELFMFTSIRNAWKLLRGEQVASSLRMSGPIALYHAIAQWGW